MENDRDHRIPPEWVTSIVLEASRDGGVAPLEFVWDHYANTLEQVEVIFHKLAHHVSKELNHTPCFKKTLTFLNNNYLIDITA